MYLTRDDFSGEDKKTLPYEPSEVMPMMKKGACLAYSSFSARGPFRDCVRLAVDIDDDDDDHGDDDDGDEDSDYDFMMMVIMMFIYQLYLCLLSYYHY